MKLNTYKVPYCYKSRNTGHLEFKEKLVKAEDEYAAHLHANYAINQEYVYLAEGDILISNAILIPQYEILQIPSYQEVSVLENQLG